MLKKQLWVAPLLALTIIGMGVTVCAQGQKGIELSKDFSSTRNLTAREIMTGMRDEITNLDEKSWNEEAFVGYSDLSAKKALQNLMTRK